MPTPNNGKTNFNPEWERGARKMPSPREILDVLWQSGLGAMKPDDKKNDINLALKQLSEWVRDWYKKNYSNYCGDECIDAVIEDIAKGMEE